jgi:2-succinyl-5-enolpyruvyl-6-hydroxy-3-cyclohexene-1-carboxylate synthase
MVSAGLALGWQAALAINRSRSPRVVGSGFEEYRRVVVGTLAVFGSLAVVSLLFKLQFARGYLVIALPVGLVLLLLTRWIARRVLARQREKNHRCTTRVLAVGSASALDISQVIESTVSGRPGPVQVNVQFEPPLMPAWDDLDWKPTVSITKMISGNAAEQKQVDVPSNGVFVVGDNADVDALEDINVLSRELGWPIIWEPTANAHMLPNAISHGVVLLQAGIAPKVDVVVTFGTVGLSRATLGLLKNVALHLAIHSSIAGADLPDPVSSAKEIYDCVPRLKTKVDPGWLSQWQALDHKAATAIAAELAPDTLSGPSAAQLVWNQVGENDQLFVAASWPVRHLEAYASTRLGLTVFGNRGANGIDGLISTAAGVAIGTKKQTVLLMGDIAFLHDLGGLNLGEGQDQPNLTIVVLDNNGSGIFSQLEQGANEYQEHYEKVFGTPHGKDLWVIAESLGIPAKQVTTKTELKFALESFEKMPGSKVIVCLTGDRSAENDLIKQIFTQVTNS